MIIHGGSSAKSIDIMQMAMGAASKRSSVIMNNIANATTPNYKRQDINCARKKFLESTFNKN